MIRRKVGEIRADEREGKDREESTGRESALASHRSSSAKKRREGAFLPAVEVNRRLRRGRPCVSPPFRNINRTRTSDVYAPGESNLKRMRPATRIRERRRRRCGEQFSARRRDAFPAGRRGGDGKIVPRPRFRTIAVSGLDIGFSRRLCWPSGLEVGYVKYARCKREEWRRERTVSRNLYNDVIVVTPLSLSRRRRCALFFFRRRCFVLGHSLPAVFSSLSFRLPLSVSLFLHFSRTYDRLLRRYMSRSIN